MTTSAETVTTVADPVQGTNATPTETAPTPPQKSELESAREASIARKEAALVKKQLAWQQEKAKADAILKKAEEFETARKSDPVAALKMLGFNETDIFNFLSDQQPKELTPEERAAQIAEKKASEQIEAFKKAQADEQAKIQAERDQKTLAGFKSSMTEYIAANKETLPFCSYYGDMAVAQAYQNILETVRQSNGEDVPTIAEAMADMEELYTAQWEAMNKIKPQKVEEPKVEPMKKTERSRTVDTSPTSAKPAPTVTRNRTLTNAATATSSALAKPINETREQKKERLAAVLRSFSKRQ
jgi:hypothetical protein